MRCPVCNDYSRGKIYNSIFPYLHKCATCTAHFVVKRKSTSYGEKYFEEKQKPSLVSIVLRPLLNFFYLQRVTKIKNSLKKKNASVLDYGAGSGKLVYELNKLGINAIGFEPSQGARKIAQKNNIPVLNKIKRTKGGYDLIMFWHSLEHTKNPQEVIKKMRGLLKKKGKILIAVPNIDSFEAQIAKDKWFHFTYPLHLIHFNKQSISTMLNKNGFKIKAIDYLNPEYTVSGLVQSFLNLFVSKDVLYSVVAHRRLKANIKNKELLVAVSVILLIIFSIPLVVFYFIQLTTKKTGAMVVVGWKS